MDDFGVNYVVKEHINYLIPSLCQTYSRIAVGWKDEFYAGINLKWNYQQKWLDASMDGYVNKLRQSFSHKMPHTPRYIPYRAPRKVYGVASQDTIPPDETTKVDEEKIKPIQ